MNAVGKVGSLLSKGVYSVATPFHPFGGAVDVIVVQQQDGTFRSTPWYVRFGKFQGVLKGAEKHVRISVNGIEADFHMYLDNAGEAYFVREVGYGNQSDDLVVTAESSSMNDGEICRLKQSVSDSVVVQLRDEFESSCSDGFDQSKSETATGFYDFQDVQSSLEGSAELSTFSKSEGSDSEVILVCGDGHILKAPISASEHNTENVQLSTPQFHLGPAEGTKFCEGDEEFNSGDNVRDADYFNELNASASNVASDSVCSKNNDENVLEHPLEACAGDTQHVSQTRETQIRQIDCEYFSARDREEVYTCCLELPRLAKQVGNANTEDIGFQVEVQNSQEKSSDILPGVLKTEIVNFVECKDSGGLSASSSSDFPSNNAPLDLQVDVESVGSTEHMISDRLSGNFVADDDSEAKGEQFNMSTTVDSADSNSLYSATLEEFSQTETGETQTTSSREGIQTDSSIRFEISLCGSKLYAGMGLGAAAEAFDACRISADDFMSEAAAITTNKKLIIRHGESYLTWERAAPVILGMAVFGFDMPVEPTHAIPVEPRDEDSGITTSSSRGRWRLWLNPFSSVKTLEQTNSSSSNNEVFVDSKSSLQNLLVEPTPASLGTIDATPKRLIRTNVPTVEQIASLNLKQGQNMITFSFCTRVLGTQKVDAHIYLWKWNARIVISDVDGTITKNGDFIIHYGIVTGNEYENEFSLDHMLNYFFSVRSKRVMSLVGKDWTQSGVAGLFSAIKENGYQLLFLSARAIVQAYVTRHFLRNLTQDGKALPKGPVVISPDGLLPSLYREVIRRSPHEFKIACLEDIRRLFPADYNPFYAGFGNRDTDELSYLKIGIPKGKIFIINPKGEVAITSHRVDVKSYTSLHTLVDDMFPPTLLLEQEDYNSWNYWRVPLPDIVD